MQDVQVARLVVRVDRRGHGVDDRLDRAVAEREDERADVEQREAELLAGRDRFGGGALRGERERRGHRHDRRHHVQRERDRHGHAVADPVDDQAEQDDRDREREQPGAEQVADLLLAQVEVDAPVLEHRGAHREAERRRDQGHDGPREEPAAVDAVGHALYSRLSALGRDR